MQTIPKPNTVVNIYDWVAAVARYVPSARFNKGTRQRDGKRRLIVSTENPLALECVVEHDTPEAVARALGEQPQVEREENSADRPRCAICRRTGDELVDYVMTSQSLPSGFSALVCDRCDKLHKNSEGQWLWLSSAITAIRWK